WAKQSIGNDTDIPSALSLDNSGNIFVAGEFGGSLSDTAAFDSITLTSLGGYNDFIAKLSTVTSTIPAITSPALAIGGSGEAFSYTITATNLPTSFSASGLPSWAIFSSTTGLITGSPNATGTSTVT